MQPLRTVKELDHTGTTNADYRPSKHWASLPGGITSLERMHVQVLSETAGSTEAQEQQGRFVELPQYEVAAGYLRHHQ